MRTRRCYALLVLVALALIAAACGGDEQAERRDVSQIEPALTAEGLTVCARIEPDPVTEGAVDELVLTVAISCGEDDDRADVAAVEWPDEAARDAALRRFEVQSRPSSANHGTTWALGPLTVSVSGERDDAVVERVADAMERLGAS